MSDPKILKEFWYDLTDDQRNAILQNCHEEYDNFLQGKPFNQEFVRKYFKVIDEKFRRHIKEGSLEFVKMDIQLGVDIHADDDLALQTAAKKGHLEIVNYLLDYGSDVHVGDDYALKWAASCGHLSVVKCLAQHGANIHADNDYALKWTEANGHLKVVEYLKSLS